MRDRLQRKLIFFLLLAIAFFLWAIFQLTSVKAQDTSEAKLPLPQVHVLPPYLEKWNDSGDRGDYFDRIASTPMGYLIWSEFPIKVYVEKPKITGDRSATNIRSENWLKSVTDALQEWDEYLPLIEIESPELADITIKRSPPPMDAKINPKTGLFEIPRARTAQTHYQFYLKSIQVKAGGRRQRVHSNDVSCGAFYSEKLQESAPSKRSSALVEAGGFEKAGGGIEDGDTKRENKVVSQRMTVEISPDRGDRIIKAAARHELGHALGIWGHSPNENDALYFSTTSDSPAISIRDINTLKKIYQQKTRLGWSIQSN
jgi:predicted Zn-dependent protease